MNLILLEASEAAAPLAPDDPRSVHILKVLRRGVGDLFDAGIVNGPRGKATISSITASGLGFTFEATAEAPEADPVHLVVAMARPQTARKILNEAAALGVSSIRFFQSEKGEASYASSTLWSSGEWRRHLMDGAAQAFDTRLPDVLHADTLSECLKSLPSKCIKVALDNYESPERLSPTLRARPLALAFGPERGWSASERTLLRGIGFDLAHLGTRVLRTETAVVAALAIVKAANA
ncbi:MAG TPA: RsmE family RNA methyltransferase [Opitutaceae bacterium]|nr:RsmE family RNA methyltransferase [Opitutaceae bacterium]